jgi:hypothetical protein
MTDLLQSYLTQTGRLPLQHIGMLCAETMPAKYDVAERAFAAPAIDWQFESHENADTLPVQHLIGFLSQQMDVTEEEAFEAYNQYTRLLKNNISNQGVYEWAPLGTFLKAASGYEFNPSGMLGAFSSLPIEKVIRGGVAHQMVVGDTETTTVAMEAFLNEEADESGKWWVAPLLIALAALTLIVWKRFGS